MVSLDKYLMGRELRFPISEEQKKNALLLLDKISQLEKIFGEDLVMTSGYRPSQINALIPGAAPKSTHQSCEGIDLRDDGLSDFLSSNLELLSALGLYMEAPRSAVDHVHLQTRAPKSGKRVFIA